MTRLFVCFIACSIAAALVAPGCKLQKKESVSPDELAARKVVELVDSIHTHTWSPETDAACDAARDAWAALTPEQKALVHGEFASREFFEEGVDAPEPDDPLNADGIGENEILVASFGTSYNEGRVLDIGGIEKRIAREFPDWSVRRAFTSQIVVNHIRARDGEKIDNLTQALDRAAANGVKRLRRCSGKSARRRTKQTRTKRRSRKRFSPIRSPGAIRSRRRLARRAVRTARWSETASRSF